MDRSDLQPLSKDQLIELVLRLQRPDKNSRTSSKPPSTDKKEKPENSRPGGAKPGHEPHFPTDTRGKPRVDDRRVISGIIHVLVSGCRWKDAPSVYGPRKTLYNRFQRWAAKGVWSNMFHALATAGGPPAEVLIDSSAVKAHRCASGGKGGSRARRSAALAASARPKSMP